MREMYAPEDVRIDEKDINAHTNRLASSARWAEFSRMKAICLEKCRWQQLALGPDGHYCEGKRDNHSVSRRHHGCSDALVNNYWS